MQIQEAINHVADIRRQLAVVEDRSAFRCLSIGVSGGLVFVGAAVQRAAAVEIDQLNQFLSIWIAVAAASLILISCEVGLRTMSTRSRLNREWCARLAQSITPALIVGVMLTWCAQTNPSLTAWLPGLWSVFYGLGLVCASRLLPKACNFAAIYFLIGGILFVKYTNIWEIGSASQMSILFGIGQLVFTACLFHGIKRHG